LLQCLLFPVLKSIIVNYKLFRVITYINCFWFYNWFIPTSTTQNWHHVHIHMKKLYSYEFVHSDFINQYLLLTQKLTEMKNTKKYIHICT
jgi:hypothetical protein